MSRFQKSAINLFSIVFAVLFVWIASMALTECFWDYARNDWILVCTIVITVVFVGLGWIGRNKTGISKRDKWALLVFFIVYILIQSYFGSQLYSREGTSWDFNVVAGHAWNYATFRGSNEEYIQQVFGESGSWYFSSWPNNAPLYCLLACVFRAFSYLGANPNFVGIGLNIFCIDLSLLLLFYLVRKLTNSSYYGWLALVLACLHSAFLVYVPIYYTDTITLPFPIGALSLWTKGREAEKPTRQFGWYAVCAALLAIGSVLKFSVVIFFFAVLIGELFTRPAKEWWKTVLCLLAVFLIVYFVVNAACMNAPIVVTDREECYIPKLHWVMMGLFGTGGYNDNDYKLTLALPAADRDEFVQTMIRQRLQNYGFDGFMQHMKEKISYIWSDGTYFSSAKIDRCRVKESWLDQYFNFMSPDFAYVCALSEGLMVFLEAMMAVGALALVRKKEKEPAMIVALISVFGLFLFECLWEARSRYLFNYLPVFILIAIVTISGIRRKKNE